MKNKVSTDGKSQKSRPVRGLGKRNSPHSSKGMGENRPEGQTDGYDQNGSAEGYSSGENLFSRIESLIGGGDFDPGKVLEAVRMIRDAHLSYVRAHKQRLKTRLDEAEHNETDFMKACDLVEQKIQGFIKTETTSETEENS
ncbi:hypothetical protein [Nostoc sp. MS1]|uniref:hypothetical protein n=1 Tax=Nostoc sp. MS1 TaxID=2764711 RepID=UPI001CC3677D|nr:hypothetical protein [Nostoc sp. MS1]